ncbi:hypothetical protein CYY_001419 [Polysphondylium violaceum]|uniref:Large ribosomal subunit protein eL14 domain-containing protein n=1 Tax=Polysphondylium violaceum TaxID=133409 RepID=A0A8J4VAM1_9MYCE|nr:hypothetical protein CYY_001419 [Polysphondylium violaceum]
MISKFSLFVEIGRVVLINYGPLLNKTAIIIDVLDQNRVLVHGPTTGVERQIVNIKWITLTKLTIKVQRGARLASLMTAIKAADLDNKVAQLNLVKKITAASDKAALTDFARFKLRLAKSKVNKKVNNEVRKLVNEANRNSHKKMVAQKAKGHVKKTK